MPERVDGFQFFLTNYCIFYKLLLVVSTVIKVAISEFPEQMGEPPPPLIDSFLLVSPVNNLYYRLQNFGKLDRIVTI